MNKKDVHSQPVADTQGDQNPTKTLLSVPSNLVIQCTKEAVNYKIRAVSYKMSFSAQMDDRVLTRINTKYRPPSYCHMNIIVLAQRLHDSSEKASQSPCWNQPVLLELVLSSEHNNGGGQGERRWGRRGLIPPPQLFKDEDDSTSSLGRSVLSYTELFDP